MGRRHRADAIDLACRSWAKQKRLVLGVDATHFSHQCLGPLSCTLERIRRLHDGAASTSGQRQQHFPEVYTGLAQVVNRAYHGMRFEQRVIMDAHYVMRGPVSAKIDALALSPKTYFNRLNQVRSFVEGFLARDD